MNRYGTLAQEHYEKFLPDELAKIPEGQRASFFSSLGEEIAVLVEAYEQDLRGPDRVDEPQMERIGRFNMARMQAEEQALGELLPAPAADEEPQELLTDSDICLLHRLDLGDEDPDRRAEAEMRLAELRDRYRAEGRYRPPT